ncbi:MAG: hypothetical protein DWI70_06260 [Chloroflexi bacterium]|nr:MAG: hypothetical protein DWI70_06260 [Chloroflexota bacterium]
MTLHVDNRHQCPNPSQDPRKVHTSRVEHGKILSEDQILVLDHGRIVERGQHAELRRAGGLYGELAEMQFGLVESGTP